MTESYLTPEPLPPRTFTEADAAVEYLTEIYERNTAFLPLIAIWQVNSKVLVINLALSQAVILALTRPQPPTLKLQKKSEPVTRKSALTTQVMPT